MIWSNILEAQINADSLLKWEWQYFKTQNQDFIFKKVNHYKSNREFEAALDELIRFEDQRVVYQREKATLLYLNRRFEESLTCAQKAIYMSDNRIDSFQIAQLIFLAAVELKNWQVCKQIADEIFEGEKLSKFRELFENDPKLLSAKKAVRLQKIFPGLGQLYAKKTSRALWSLLLQGGSLSYTISSFLTGHYASGVLTGGGLWFRFYQGGIRHTQFLTEQENLRREQLFKKKIKDRFFD